MTGAGLAVVTAAEIARIAGVGRAAVSNWRRRCTDFPVPVGGTAASPHFALGAVVDWLRGRGRPVSLAPGDEAWLHLDAARDPARPAAVLTAAGAVLAGDAGDGLPPATARLITALGGTLGAGPAFETLLERWTTAHARTVEVTPAPVAELMAALAAGPDGRAPALVLDPACGTGGLLTAAAAAGAKTVCGQEADVDLAAVARIRLQLHHLVDGGLLAAGDSLRRDAHTGLRADAVLLHPPGGQRAWSGAGHRRDPRWVYGVPPGGEPELAWLQHALAHLAPGGTAVVAMPAAAASRRSGLAIRAALVRSGALRAVIALPATPSVAYQARGAHLWVARPPEESPAGAGAGSHLAVDVSGLEPAAARDAVVPVWTALQAGRPLPDGPHHALVPAARLLGDVDLNPAAHVPGPALSAEALIAQRAWHAARIAEIDAALHRETPP
ncbi:class I SAM-dependent DNA methyltransferase [Streptomyces jumonjinensis]|uniref:class I SAM-dependent DNA methyltransferase n=1 Tax=Streptomyces jumonjinensis TaxID=1945 RepID=UPI0037897C5A